MYVVLGSLLFFHLFPLIFSSKLHAHVSPIPVNVPRPPPHSHRTSARSPSPEPPISGKRKYTPPPPISGIGYHWQLQKKKHPLSLVFSGNRQKYPLSRENGNAHVGPLMHSSGGGGGGQCRPIFSFLNHSALLLIILYQHYPSQ